VRQQEGDRLEEPPFALLLVDGHLDVRMVGLRIGVRARHDAPEPCIAVILILGFMRMILAARTIARMRVAATQQVIRLAPTI